MPCPDLSDILISMEDNRSLIGTVLRERYRVERVLGEGAHGTVYHASDLKLDGASWALKEICEGSLPLSERAGIIAHFYREAETLKTLNHTGLPKVIEAFAADDRHYLVMEQIEGKTLQDISEMKKPDIQAVTGWAIKLCEIFTYLHTLSPSPLIFRDLKPSNIMVTSRGRMTLIDFGIARYYDPHKTSDTVPLGTPGYAAPEQYGNSQTDARSDIYSLGATLYSLLSGADVASFNLSFPPLSRLNPSVGPVLEGIVERCLSLSPEQRYQRASDVKSALLPLHRRKQRAPLPRRRPIRPASASAASPKRPVNLAPVPAAARLWNSAPYRHPITISFAPPWLTALIENLDLLAKRIAWTLPLLIVASLYLFALEGSVHTTDGALSYMIFYIIASLCLFSLLIFVLHRLYSYAVFVLLALITESGILYTLVRHINSHTGLLQ